MLPGLGETERLLLEKRLEGKMIVYASLADGLATLYLDDGTELVGETDDEAIRWEIKPNGYVEKRS